MTRRRSTTDLADLILDILNRGAGNLDPTVDQIVIAYHDHFHVALRTAQANVHKSLDAALRCLQDDEGWLSVPVTDHFYRDYDKRPHTDPELKRSIAGVGRGSSRHGLHFLRNADGEDDTLFIMARILGITNGIGKVNANARRIEIAAESGQVSPAAVAGIATTISAGARKTARKLRSAGEKLALISGVTPDA